MPRKRHKAEEIVAKLRQVDVLVSQGQNGAPLPSLRFGFDRGRLAAAMMTFKQGLFTRCLIARRALAYCPFTNSLVGFHSEVRPMPERNVSAIAAMRALRDELRERLDQNEDYRAWKALDQVLRELEPPSLPQAVESALSTMRAPSGATEARN